MFRWVGRRGLDGIPMEGMFVEIDRGGILIRGKRQSMCVLSILKFAYTFVQATFVHLYSLSFHLLEYPVKSRLCKIVHCESTRPSGHLVPK